jgi:hypothetical protein
MFVLGDAEPAVKTIICNDMEQYQSGKLLHEYLKKLLDSKEQDATPMAAACYHMDLESENNEVTFFMGHLDKPFVHTVWFVPLGESSFFTVLSVPKTFHQSQDEDSLLAFNDWKQRLKQSERQTVDDFVNDFKVQAKKYMRQELLDTLIFLNKRGSLLCFPANQCYHATITPKKPSGYPRDVLIVHPLDGPT